MTTSLDAHRTIIRQAASNVGGVLALSRKLGLSHAAVSQWPKIPKRRVQAVADITGMSPAELRPDLYPERSSGHDSAGPPAAESISP